mmetsp:Transcript_31272/g.81985  ORF Transcript_31272/g.81985 Transcript_31272/m.81985 type:complete len:248 (-) Transcript_31272:343-1086(-)
MMVPTPISPPGTAYCSSFFSAKSDSIREKMGVTCICPLSSFDTIPGRTSISCPFLSTPRRILPPATPPFSSSTSAPGLFTSNDRITISRGDDVKSRTGTGSLFAMYSQTTSMLYLSWAEIGMTGACSASVPLTNAMICSCCSVAWGSFTRSILFCRMSTCLSFMISIAARCSDVWGCGHDSFAAMRSSAASITAAPLSIVAIKMSCPGQSTKETCRISCIVPCSHGNSSSFELPHEMYEPSRGAVGQ